MLYSEPKSVFCTVLVNSGFSCALLPSPTSWVGLLIPFGVPTYKGGNNNRHHLPGLVQALSDVMFKPHDTSFSVTAS